MNEYYVYEWIRLDTNEPFYVGKGKKDRWCKIKRHNNKHFYNIINSVPVAVNILLNNLTEQEAFEYEVWFIYEYRDVIGYPLINITDGGDGGPVLCGKDNYFYGKRFFGELNAMYGKKRPDMMGDKNPMRRPEFKDFFKGEKNPNYGKGYRIRGENHPLWGKKHSEESKKKMSENSKNKPNKKSRKIRCITTNKEFDFIKQGANYYGLCDSSLNKHLKGKKNHSYCGKLEDGTKLYWEFIE